MCECFEYDDGSMHLCSVDADRFKEWEKMAQEAIAANPIKPNYHFWNEIKSRCETCDKWFDDSEVIIQCRNCHKPNEAPLGNSKNE